MKKFLFSTTALAVAGAFAFGADANAAAKPIKLSLGGFMTTEMGFGENSGSFESDATGATTTSNKRSEFNNVQDSEVYFRGSSKLDSGVTVSVTIQLEADQAAAAQNIDESYMKLTGAFGDLRLGSTTGVNSVLKHVAPAVGQHPRLGGSDNYITVPAAVGASNSTDFAGSGDANKIAYISPRVGGMAFGLGFTPSVANSNAAPVSGGNGADEGQIVEAVLSYETTMGTSSVQMDVAGSTRNNKSRSLRAGVVVGFGGWKVGGSIADRSDNDDVRKSAAGSVNANAYDLGVTYAMGEYTFGLTKAYGEQTDGDGTKDKQSKWAAGVQLAIDTGVTGKLTFTKADYDDGASGAETTKNEGHSLVGSIGVAF